MICRLRRTALGVSVAAALALPALAAAAAAPSAAKGAQTYVKVGCNGCHRIDGKGGQMGPDLSKVGKTSTAAKIRTKIVNPKVDNANSLMPAAAALQLSNDDVADITAYLAGKK